jgi:CRISPR-associated endonuclease/helicase Cas3
MIDQSKMNGFSQQFETLTSFKPMPWQARLFEEYFSQGRIPKACSLPTGLGKTSVVAIWLSALCHKADIPRRLIYVVNRRTVVDQTTDEVVRYAKVCKTHEIFTDFRQRFGGLRISTLRGQFADNGDWCEDPSVPAVICGTVDMIGSRLLFSGYGIGRASRPLHAGFLGQDSLLIHDEAHLEPAFQQLIEKIEEQQHREAPVRWPKLKCIELTATSKTDDAFRLNKDDYGNEVVRSRMESVKKIILHELADPKKPAKELSAQALEFKESERSVLIFVSSVEAVLEIQGILDKAKLSDRVVTLTGTMRGKERDELVENPVFRRFLPQPASESKTGTVYLICTSAGEVGVNISADHMICDLSTFESMAQRFGRVNRFGLHSDTQAHVFHPSQGGWDDKDVLATPRKKTLEILRKLESDPTGASPRAIGELPQNLKNEAFAPDPVTVPATDRLFDAWCLTTINVPIPGRPPVEPFLHGIRENELPETRFAWRLDVDFLRHDGIDDDQRTEVTYAFPLLPMELLKEPSYRAIKHLQLIANRCPDDYAWLLDTNGFVTELPLNHFLDKDNKELIEGATVILSPNSGGLSKSGMLDGNSEFASDESESVDRMRCVTADPLNAVPNDLHEVYSLTIPIDDDDGDAKTIRWYARRNSGEVASRKPVEWGVHVADVEARLKKILDNLSLGDTLNRCLILAARYHDHGKRRTVFQSILGNKNYPEQCWAKSGKHRGLTIAEKYRHEFGSLHDLPTATELEITEVERELVLHLIASHHGRARPHFPMEEIFDPSSTPDIDVATASSVPQRFGRLQIKYGRWGLAYLESLLRAADWSASANPSVELEVRT